MKIRKTTIVFILVSVIVSWCSPKREDNLQNADVNMQQASQVAEQLSSFSKDFEEYTKMTEILKENKNSAMQKEKIPEKFDLLK